MPLKYKQQTNKSRQQRGFFAAQAFALQIKQSHGLHYVALLRTHKSALQQQNAMPRPAAQANMFCLISPEAYLLPRLRILS